MLFKLPLLMLMLVNIAVGGVACGTGHVVWHGVNGVDGDDS